MVHLREKNTLKTKHVMHVLHDDFKAGINYFVGGTQLHVSDIINKTEGIVFSVLSRHAQYLYFTLYENGMEKNELRFYVGDVDTNTEFYSKKFADIYHLLLCGFQIDLVHIHHLKNHTLDIVFEARKQNIPVIVSLHDYYMACPTINLIDADNKYCAAKTNEERCCACTSVRLGKSTYILDNWRQMMSEVFKASDLVVAPSASVKKVFEDCYPILNRKIVILPHGGIDYKRVGLPQRIGDTLNVAFVGGMVEHKGSRFARELIMETRDEKIQWHIFGQIYDNVLLELEEPHLIKHGRYAKKDIFQLLEENNIHIVCILSVCPESFCYTLSEVWQCNIPVIVTNIGALADRVNETSGGIIVDPDKVVAKTKEAIFSLRDNHEQYIKLCNVIREIKCQTASQMANNYKIHYLNLFKLKQPILVDDTNMAELMQKIKDQKREYIEQKSQNYDNIKPKLSLVICTYMGKKFLSQQLKSIFDQTIPPDEIILCDDNSSDDTYEYGCALLRDSGIAYIARKNLNNLGFVKNFERGIMLARGEYITLSDQDDVWMPNKNQKLMDAIIEIEKKYSIQTPILSFCDCMLTDSNMDVIEKSYCVYNKMHPHRMIKNKYSMCIQNIVTGMSCMFNSALLKKAMPIPAGIMAHDWWLALIASFLGKITFVDESLVYYRQHNANILGAPKNEPAIMWTKQIWHLYGILRNNWYNYRTEHARRVYHIQALKKLTGDQKLDLIEFGLLNGGKKITIKLFLIGATPADWRRKIFFVAMMLKYREFSCPETRGEDVSLL